MIMDNGGPQELLLPCSANDGLGPGRNGRAIGLEACLGLPPDALGVDVTEIKNQFAFTGALAP
jgi:hypothetical protein